MISSISRNSTCEAAASSPSDTPPRDSNETPTLERTAGVEAVEKARESDFAMTLLNIYDYYQYINPSSRSQGLCIPNGCDVVIIRMNQRSDPLAKNVKGVEVGRVIVLVWRGRRRRGIETLTAVETVLLRETSIEGHSVDTAKTARRNIQISIAVGVSLLVRRLI